MGQEVTISSPHGDGSHEGQHGPAFLQHHFDTPAQQFSTAKLGMWAFLAQEILFFSGLFVAYGIYRSWYPAAFQVGSHLLDWRWGGFNTGILLLSSFTAAMAVRAAQSSADVRFGGRVWTGRFLLMTIAFAFGFMIVKYIEYSHKFHVGFMPGDAYAPTAEGLAEIQQVLRGPLAYLGLEQAPYQLRSFFGIYFMMTGVHGLHVLVGIGVLGWIYRRSQRGEFGPAYFTPVELVALYWHLVDLIWIYLFPFLYLID